MKHSLKSILKNSLITGSGMFFIGCNLGPNNADENQNITIDANSVASVAFQELGNSSSSTVNVTNPAPSDLFNSSMEIPDFSLKTGLGKSSISGNIAWSIDTVGDKIRLTGITNGTGYTRYDTLDVKLNSRTFDQIDNNEDIISVHGKIDFFNGVIETYSITDLDNDGILKGEGNLSSKAALSKKVLYTKATLLNRINELHELTLNVDAGTDHNFDTHSDNYVLAASWVKTISNDTIAYAMYKDADNDGIIVGPKGKEYIFDAIIYNEDIFGRPLVQYGTMNCRISRNADSTEKTIRFTAEEKFKTGRINKVWIVDTNGDSTISSGELAKIYFTTKSPYVADTAVSATAQFVVDPGTDLLKETDNLLHEVHFTKENRIGIVKNVNFNFIANPPIPHGEKATGGTFDCKVDYINGKSASLQGTFTTGILNATYTDPDGVTTKVNIDQNGKVIEK